jgi:pantetheine-phosphate adenylyltransferase
MSNINRKYIITRLEGLGVDAGVLENYNEAHRYYHTLSHVIAVLEFFAAKDMLANDTLFLAAVFHDIIYNPRANDNEEQSAKLFKACFKGDEQLIHDVEKIILDTKTHNGKTALSKVFQDADLAIFDAAFEDLIIYENQIFKEFQFADWKLYKTERVKVLQQFNTNGKLDTLIGYINTFKPNIGVYAGSFNPFHKGHYNILQKAEQIFDKVIIAFGKNPDKNDKQWEIPQVLLNRQIESYEGLVTDFIEDLGYEVTLIRGLRNIDDFHYEEKQYRYMQDLKPNIKLVSIFSDIEFDHISSSGIKVLEKYNKHHEYLLYNVH